MLPVYAHQDLQVEEIFLDRGNGVRPWWKVRHGADVMLCGGRAEVNTLLHEYGLNLSEFAQVDLVEDGCE